MIGGVAVVAAVAALLAGAAPAAAQAGNAVQEPTPSEAAGAADGIVRAVGNQAAEIQRALGLPAPDAKPSLTEDEVETIAGTSERLHDWIDDRELSRTAVDFDETTRVHTVFYVSEDDEGKETVEAQVLVADESGEITEVRTGPQVAWSMARGYDGAFGRAITRPAIWIPLCLLFLIPLLPATRPRRLLSWRTLDLLALLSFGVSLIWFNRGEIYTSVPLQYPPMVYLAARLAWIALARARAARRPARGRGDRAAGRPAAGLRRVAADLAPGDPAGRGARAALRPQRLRLERHRRGLRGGHRRRPHRPRRDPVREHARGTAGRATRTGR